MSEPRDNGTPDVRALVEGVMTLDAAISWLPVCGHGIGIQGRRGATAVRVVGWPRGRRPRDQEQLVYVLGHDGTAVVVPWREVRLDAQCWVMAD